MGRGTARGSTWAASLVLATVTIPALARVADAERGPPTVQVIVLPTRTAAAELAASGRSVGREVTARLGGRLLVREHPPHGSTELTAAIARASRLAEEGALDEAAQTFDLALDAGARNPHEIDDLRTFVGAHVTRASIALARGERPRALELLARVVAYDPSFALLPAEDSPRMRGALEEITGRGDPVLGRAILAEACDQAEVLLVVRRVPGALEHARVERCNVRSSVRVAAGSPTSEIADRLVPDRAARPVEAKPFYRKAWFWTVVGTAVIGGAVAGFALRPEDSRDVWVVPNF